MNKLLSVFLLSLIFLLLLSGCIRETKSLSEQKSDKELESLGQKLEDMNKTLGEIEDEISDLPGAEDLNLDLD